MFANALVIVAVIVLATATILSAGLAMTRAQVHRIAQQYLAAGYERAATVTRDTLADALRNGRIDPSAPASLPAISPLPSQCATSSSPCAFFTDATVTLAAPAAPSANLESNAAINEGRLTATVAVDVTAADGTRLATRTQTVALRTFAVPPYVTIAGALDASVDGAGGTAAGDDGGLPPQTPLSTCPTPAPSSVPSSSAPDETVVRVQYHDDANGACMDGSLWQGKSSSANDPLPWSP
ncbi:MAG: hypothetical protein ACXWNJ_17075 [Vulcanimicrobiaceae bacterium]